jgi:hypothetical protein
VIGFVEVASLSPGLPYSATLGHRVATGPNPKGVATIAKDDDEQIVAGVYVHTPQPLRGWP